MDRVEQLKMLENPTSSLSIFKPTPEKLLVAAKHIFEGYLHLSDEFRNYDFIHKMLQEYLTGPSIVYEINGAEDRFLGLLGFVNIFPGIKAGTFIKIFDNSFWGPTFARENKQIYDKIMDTFGLQRLSTQSPDPRIVKLAVKFGGFSVEGMRKKDFVWNGKYYDNYLLGRVREDKVDFKEEE